MSNPWLFSEICCFANLSASGQFRKNDAAGALGACISASPCRGAAVCVLVCTLHRNDLLALDCNGTVTLTALSGNITDHTGGGDYPERVLCTWILHPSTPVQFIR